MSTSPSHAACSNSCQFHSIVDAWNIGIVNDHVAFLEQSKLLDHLLLLALEACIVGSSNVGENADGRTDDLLEVLHLTWLTYSCLEQGDVSAFMELPDA